MILLLPADAAATRCFDIASAMFPLLCPALLLPALMLPFLP